MGSFLRILHHSEILEIAGIWQQAQAMDVIALEEP